MWSLFKYAIILKYAIVYFGVYVTIVMWSVIQTMTTIDASASPVNSLAPRFGIIHAVKIFSLELAGWRYMIFEWNTLPILYYHNVVR